MFSKYANILFVQGSDNIRQEPSCHSQQQSKKTLLYDCSYASDTQWC